MRAAHCQVACASAVARNPLQARGKTLDGHRPVHPINGYGTSAPTLFLGRNCDR